MSSKPETKQDTKQPERKQTDFSKLDTVTLSFNRPAKWYMYVVKQVLKTRDSCDIRARPLGAAQVVRVAEALKRLGYITYEKYYTQTLVEKERLQRLNKIVNEYSNMNNKKLLDKTVDVLITGVSDKDPNKLCGYTDTFKLVNVTSGKRCIGEIIKVKITDAKSFSLDGIAE